MIVSRHGLMAVTLYQLHLIVEYITLYIICLCQPELHAVTFSLQLLEDDWITSLVPAKWEGLKHITNTNSP